jgi:hypothetical protein
VIASLDQLAHAVLGEAGTVVTVDGCAKPLKTVAGPTSLSGHSLS